MEVLPPQTKRVVWHRPPVLLSCGRRRAYRGRFDALEQDVRAILADAVADHAGLVLAEIVEHAVPLRTSGVLASWQRELAHYPDSAQERPIAAAIEDWSFPHVAAARLTTCPWG